MKATQGLQRGARLVLLYFASYCYFLFFQIYLTSNKAVGWGAIVK
jgi:hypothetical protein